MQYRRIGQHLRARCRSVPVRGRDFWNQNVAALFDVATNYVVQQGDAVICWIESNRIIKNFGQISHAIGLEPKTNLCSWRPSGGGGFPNRNRQLGHAVGCRRSWSCPGQGWWRGRSSANSNWLKSGKIASYCHCWGRARCMIKFLSRYFVAIVEKIGFLFAYALVRIDLKRTSDEKLNDRNRINISNVIQEKT